MKVGDLILIKVSGLLGVIIARPIGFRESPALRQAWKVKMATTMEEVIFQERDLEVLNEKEQV